MQIVTGATGELHVTSAMDGARNAGAFGSGQYVLPTKNRLACTSYGSYYMTIAPGDLVMNGRHGVVELAETVEFDPGSQGVNRNDLVCARYQSDGEGMESMELVVIKGTTTSGTATDPEYNSASILEGGNPSDFPLYRVPFAGAAMGRPVQLFEVLGGGIYDLWQQKPALEHRHSASDVNSGVLVVARGGTGRASHNVNHILTGNGAAQVKNVAPANGAFYATSSEGPAKFGTLQVAQGGTGRTSHNSNHILTGNGAAQVKNVATANGAFYATAANGAAKFGTLPVAQGGTGGTTPTSARRSLQLGYGTPLKSGIHLASGAMTTIESLANWNALVVCLTSNSSDDDKTHPCLALRTPGIGAWQVFGGFDNGSSSFVWVGTLTSSGQVLTCTSLSRHRLSGSSEAVRGYITNIYGAW